MISKIQTKRPKTRLCIKTYFALPVCRRQHQLILYTCGNESEHLRVETCSTNDVVFGLLSSHLYLLLPYPSFHLSSYSEKVFCLRRRQNREVNTRSHISKFKMTITTTSQTRRQNSPRQQDMMCVEEFKIQNDNNKT